MLFIEYYFIYFQQNGCNLSCLDNVDNINYSCFGFIKKKLLISRYFLGEKF